MVANDNIVVGEDSAKTSDSHNSTCSGRLKDGNYVIMNKTSDHISLYGKPGADFCTSGNGDIFFEFNI